MIVHLINICWVYQIISDFFFISVTKFKAFPFFLNFFNTSLELCGIVTCNSSSNCMWLVQKLLYVICSGVAVGDLFWCCCMWLVLKLLYVTCSEVVVCDMLSDYMSHVLKLCVKCSPVVCNIFLSCVWHVLKLLYVAFSQVACDMFKVVCDMFWGYKQQFFKMYWTNDYF